MTEISEDGLAELSEFSLLRENAEQAGVTGPLPDVRRVEAGTGASKVSALRWGGAPPRIVFLHGGGQNAHTWDTVIVGLGEPALAVDLPGHGHSGWREDGDYSPQHNADALLPVLREHAPSADLVVGMSLGGLTAHTAGRGGARTRERTRPDRRHPVGAATALRDDQGTARHGGVDARRTRIPQLPGHAGPDDRRGAAPRGEGAAPRRVPQLAPARQRQLDVALRRHPRRSPTSPACGTTSTRCPHPSP